MHEETKEAIRKSIEVAIANGNRQEAAALMAIIAVDGEPILRPMLYHFINQMASRVVAAQERAKAKEN